MVLDALAVPCTGQATMKCDIDGCGIEAEFRLARIESRRLAVEKEYCDAHAREYFLQFRSKVFVGIGAHHVEPGAVCVDIEIVSYHIGPEQTPACIYLREVGGDRCFRTMVTRDAYCALMTEIAPYVPPRPFAHTAWAATIRELGGVVQDVVDRVSDADEWFNGRVRIRKDGGLISVDVRSSDAYILAVISGVPIFLVEEDMHRVFAGKGGW